MSEKYLVMIFASFSLKIQQNCRHGVGGGGGGDLAYERVGMLVANFELNP